MYWRDGRTILLCHWYRLRKGLKVKPAEPWNREAYRESGVKFVEGCQSVGVLREWVELNVGDIYRIPGGRTGSG